MVASFQCGRVIGGGWGRVKRGFSLHATKGGDGVRVETRRAVEAPWRGRTKIRDGAVKTMELQSAQLSATAGELETFRIGLRRLKLGRVTGGDGAQHRDPAAATPGAMRGTEVLAAGLGLVLRLRKLVHVLFRRWWEGQPPLPAPTIVPRMFLRPLFNPDRSRSPLGQGSGVPSVNCRDRDRGITYRGRPPRAKPGVSG